jgi:hypothetical protein
MISGYARVAEAVELLRAIPTAAGEARLAPIGPDRNVREARLLRDHLSRFHLIVSLPLGRATFTPLTSELLPAKWLDTDFEGGNEVCLDVICEDDSLNPTFFSLIGEMLERVEATGRACMDELMRVLASWREALARERGLLSKQGVIGLFGELIVLRTLARRDPNLALAAWRGQEGYRHDFFLSNALEVKSYTSFSSPSVTIHGAFQLDPPVGGALHLVAMRLEESPIGETIDELIESIEDLGIGRKQLFQRSSSERPISSDDRHSFLVAEERIFEIVEQFPGIRASKLSADALIGLSHLSYTLLLDSCSAYQVDTQLDALLDSL